MARRKDSGLVIVGGLIFACGFALLIKSTFFGPAALELQINRHSKMPVSEDISLVIAAACIGFGIAIAYKA
ncbi:hypothetical protein [Pseudomonas paeninsulae]|uniref:hypothetical protein n=1 Tax=Pseudomonas paeninsulae TaxID=3110772 RepID=UPI002D78A7DF|nr:hypothetical protein [Pseudomonas sp. IT1137]